MDAVQFNEVYIFITHNSFVNYIKINRYSQQSVFRIHCGTFRPAWLSSGNADKYKVNCNLKFYEKNK